MTAEQDLKSLFQEWNELNSQTQQSLGEFDFAKIKEIRKKQKVNEDLIFEILKKNAPEDIKALLPEDCGEMEVGYESEEKVFYFVMFDPENEINDESKEESDEEIKLIAITIDTNKNINLIKEFEME